MTQEQADALLTELQERMAEAGFAIVAPLALSWCDMPCDCALCMAVMQQSRAIADCR